ncbi:hypothetical protein DAI22_10g127403 [Oryza sativa Japonica Group]|nr:hypothetical protein DAI22_10g127403 [Oryza sativa Japonica Group]
MPRRSSSSIHLPRNLFHRITDQAATNSKRDRLRPPLPPPKSRTTLRLLHRRRHPQTRRNPNLTASANSRELAAPETRPSSEIEVTSIFYTR